MAASNGANSSSVPTPIAGQQGKPEARVNKGGILASVDKGQEPVFGVDAINERKGKVSGEIQDQKGSKTEKSEKREVKFEAFKEVKEAKSPADAALELFEAEFKEQEQLSEADPEEKAPEGLAPDAQQRFHKLVSKAKEAEGRYQQLEASATDFQSKVNQWSSQVNNQFQQMQIENARLMERVEHLTKMRGQGQQGQAQEEIDPVEALGQKLDPRFQKAIAPLVKELNDLKQAKVQEQRQRKLQTDQRTLNLHADRAASSVLLNGFEPEDAKNLAQLGGSLTLALAWATNTNHEEAAKQLRSYMGKWAVSYMKAKTKENKARMEQTDKLPPATNSGRSAPSARGNPTPSYNEAKKAGYKDPLAMLMAKDGFEP